MSKQELYVVSDLDGVWAPTPHEIIRFGNEVLGLVLGIRDYHENIPALWGIAKEEAQGYWQMFCREWMPKLPLMKDAELTLEVMRREKIRADIFTSRRTDYASITQAWAANTLGPFRGVLHTLIDWQNDIDAHLRTKADSLHVLPRMPDIFIDDESKHAIAMAERGIQTVLFGKNPAHVDCATPINIVKLRDHGQLAEYLEEQITKFPRAA
jgi:hypothetical protein